jgi:hypothetical protein
MTIFGLSSYFSSELMYYFSPQLLTVISGILSASAGVLWFVRMRRIDATVNKNVNAFNEA